MAVASGAKPIALRAEEETTRSPWADAWYLFTRNRFAIFGMLFIIGLIVLCLTLDIWKGMGLLADPASQYQGSTGPGGNPAAPMTCAPARPGEAFQWCFLFGADFLRRDLFTRVLYGTRVSLLVALVGSSISFSVGTVYGVISGYYGGRVDNMMMRVVDFFYGLPDLPLIIVMQAFFRAMSDYKDQVGPVGAALVDLNNSWGGLLFIFIVIGLLSWIGMARLARGQVLSYKQKEFVEAARAVGAKDRRIIFIHLLPNIIGPLVVAEALSIPGYIAVEAILSFIGLGVQPPTASWGQMLGDVQSSASGFQYLPWQWMPAAVALALTTLAFNYLGDGLRDALDPSLRGR